MSNNPADDYPSTAAFTPTSRFLVALSSFRAMHLRDPSSPTTAADEPAPAPAPGASTPSLRYHSTLELYARKLSALSTVDALRRGPGEALLLAAASQHVRRWERPRKDYAEGLSGYKMWRTALNKFHADIAHDVMRQAGYVEDDEGDAELFGRVRDLLLKKTLQRAPLPEREDELKDPEAHLFEDAVCCTFLHLEFTQFASSFAGDRDKLVRLVAKTWAKMGPLGRGVAVQELVGKLGDEERQVVLDAVKGAGAAAA
ncbi:uncharacterized protein RHOBADRAFT_55521 [Rhodotorula graminis WP1]|uniref:Glutamyl-tRNA synthetase n=1 Tax=Rhodotorula graminis (strain WP1) TaxID=578459 RepID=A0A0P9F042_RHOGW|nr:uncharacterized protein RHOBADRAFT_55521 [Rhodotorula graminis WP1]KPV72847.1 hypothetical protein RHOBADRAFT_55521 [Rhodotorula graminis WP1]